MLLNQITQLTDSFILHYDGENPAAIKFREIRNVTLGRSASRGWQGWQMGSVVEIGKELRIFVEKRGKFILEKLLQVITDTRVEYHSTLNDDCKIYFAAKIKPSIQAAKGYLEQMRIEANAASGVTVEASRALDNLLLGFNAEIDFFCAKYGANSDLKDQKIKDENVIFNIGTVQGAVGSISHSPITLNPQNPQISASGSSSESEKQVAEISAKILSDKFPEPQKTMNPKCVFVVHGRNMALRDSMFSFLRAIGLQPLEWSQALKETGEASPYIGHVLDTAFSKAQAIVVLMTPDDEARLRAEFHSTHDDLNEKQLTGQARPNVLFEAGMAMGRNPKRTVLVQLGHLRPFSDIGGRHVLRLTNSSVSRQELADRLKTAGCEVDLSGTDWHSVGSFEFQVGQPDGSKEMPQPQEVSTDKPTIIAETLLVDVQVVDPSEMFAFPPKTIKKKMFAVRVRNQSVYAVNIDAIGFTIKDRRLPAKFWIPSDQSPSLPKRLESRSSLVVQFGTVETTSPSDISEIDGVYVETGCGHTISKKDDLFHTWSETADLQTIKE